MDTSLIRELIERRRSSCKLQTSSYTTQNASALGIAFENSALTSSTAKPTAKQEIHREHLEKAKAKREKLAELEQMKMKTAQLKAAISSLDDQISETTMIISELKHQLAFAIQKSGDNADKGG